MKKKIVAAVLVLMALIGAWIVNLLWVAGQFKTIDPHFAGTCTQVSGLAGPEDITIHPRSGIAYISACDRRSGAAGTSARTGIYAYDLNAAAPSPVLLTSGPAKDFQPHGISLYIGDDGRDVLFVINHAGGQNSIEVFNLFAGKLTHSNTIRDPMLVSPNDILAIGPDSFYVTNDHKYATGLLRSLEDYLRFELSNVVYFDGSGFSIVAADFGYANGINTSPDGETLYLATATERSLHVFNRDSVSGALEHRETVFLGTGLDNIEINGQGDLWIGAHPQLLTFMSHARDKTKMAPSQILRLSPQDQGGFNIEEVYLNRGEELSASSVAAVRNRRMLIGAVFDEKFLDCRL